MTRQRSEDEALRAYAFMVQGQLVPLGAELALDAARLSLELGLPVADSFILATARAFGAVLWTQDSHFEGVAGVRYMPKAKP